MRDHEKGGAHGGGDGMKKALHRYTAGAGRRRRAERVDACATAALGIRCNYRNRPQTAGERISDSHDIIFSLSPPSTGDDDDGGPLSTTPLWRSVVTIDRGLAGARVSANKWQKFNFATRLYIEGVCGGRARVRERKFDVERTAAGYSSVVGLWKIVGYGFVECTCFDWCAWFLKRYNEELMIC